MRSDSSSPAASGVAARSRARPVPAQAALAVDHERQQVRGPAEPAHGAELGERPGEVALAVGHHAQRLAGGRHPAGAAHRGLGVGQRRLEVVGLEEGRDHDQVLGHPVGVLLGQGAQLAVDGPVELLAGHPLGDARLGKARTLGGQSRPTPVLAVVRTIGWCARASAGRSPVALAGGAAATVTAATGAALAAGTSGAALAARGVPPRGAPSRHRTHRPGDPRLRDDRCSPRARHQLLGLCCRFGRPARRVTVAQCTDGHRAPGRRCNLGNHDPDNEKGPA